MKSFDEFILEEKKKNTLRDAAATALLAAKIGSVAPDIADAVSNYYAPSARAELHSLDTKYKHLVKINPETGQHTFEVMDIPHEGDRKRYLELYKMIAHER